MKTPAYDLISSADIAAIYGLSESSTGVAYLSAQKHWLSKNGIEEGDVVEITKSAYDFQYGWGDVWTGSMGTFVGRLGTVILADNEGIGVKVCVGIGNDYLHYNFPFYVLRKVVDTAE